MCPSSTRRSCATYLENVEGDSYLVIDGTRAGFIDQDIMETIQDFIKAASDYNIRVELKEMRGLEPVNGLVPAE